METLVGRRKASSAICFLLLTYLISTRAFSANTASKGRHAVALCLPTAPRYGCCSSHIRKSSAAVLSATRKQHPTAMVLARTSLQRGSTSFDRTRVPTAERSSRGAAVRLAGSASDSTEGPAAISATSIADAVTVAETPASAAGGSSLDAAEPTCSASAADAGPPLLSIKWGREQVQRLHRHVWELPEDTAEEGRFLMMAALVGVITGTAGKGVAAARVCSLVSYIHKTESSIGGCAVFRYNIERRGRVGMLACYPHTAG